MRRGSCKLGTLHSTAAQLYEKRSMRSCEQERTRRITTNGAEPPCALNSHTQRGGYQGSSLTLPERSEVPIAAVKIPVAGVDGPLQDHSKSLMTEHPDCRTLFQELSWCQSQTTNYRSPLMGRCNAHPITPTRRNGWMLQMSRALAKVPQKLRVLSVTEEGQNFQPRQEAAV